jgi:hypothetical protein
MMFQPLIALTLVLFAHSLFAQERKTDDLKPLEQDTTAEKAPVTQAVPAAGSVGWLHEARVGNGRRFTARLTPGMHGIRSDDKSSSVALDVKSGQDYYIRIDEEPGAWKGHGKLTLLQSEQGKPEYALVKPVEPERRLAKDLLEEESETSAAGANKKSAE